MYIADLTEVLCKKKRLHNAASDWVLCLADLTLALPLDRTVASLEGRTDLALVRRQWAIEHGLRIEDRRGGDPSGKSPAVYLHPQWAHHSIYFQTYQRASSACQIWCRCGRHYSNIQGE